MEKKFRITKIDKRFFFIKVGATVWWNTTENRIYSEDHKQWVQVDMALKLGIDGEEIE